MVYLHSIQILLAGCMLAYQDIAEETWNKPRPSAQSTYSARPEHTVAKPGSFIIPVEGLRT